MESLGNLETPLYITNESKAYLSETAKWGKFLAIVGFVMCGLLVILGIFMGTIFSNLTSAGASPYGAANPFGVGMSVFISVLYVAIALIYIIPCYYLYNFSTKTRIALRSDDSDKLEEALSNQKSMFKFMGIFTAIILGFYALALVFGIIGGIFAATR